MFNFFKSKYNSLSMAKAKVALEENPKIKVLDVRTKEEYKFGHLPKSINIPLDQISSVSKKITDLDTPLFVYCQSGMRSRSACSILTQSGYTDVTNIGGIGGWTGPISK